MNPTRNAPKECYTCKHRIQEEYGPALMAGIIEQQCKKFVRTDRRGEIMNMTCIGAYDKFCGGGDWSPTLMARLRIWLGRKQ